MTMIPAPGPLPLPYRTRQEVRQQTIASLTEMHAAGPDPDGRIHVNLGGQPWTGLELAEAFAFVISLYLGLAFEVEAANAEGRTVDVPECLQREALALAAAPVTGPFTGAYVDEPPGQDPW